MPVEFLVKGEAALQVASLGLDRRLGLARGFGDQVRGCQVTETRLGLPNVHRNIMG